MTPQRDELLAAFLAGEDLPVAARQQLANELRADPRFAGAARRLSTIDRLLQVTLDQGGRSAFARRVAAGIRALAAANTRDSDESDEDEPPAWQEAEMSDAELEAVAGAGADPLPEEPEPPEPKPPLEDGEQPKPPIA